MSATVREPILVVGASLAGLRAVEALRREGWDGDIVAVGAERHMPYTRPPLSKGLLLNSDNLADMAAAVQLRLRGAAAKVDWVLARAAVRTDLARRRVTLDDGTTFTFAGLVVATGLRPRRLALPGATEVRHVVRTLDDALALREQLVHGARVVVVGGGFIGCEIAATARRAGCAVTVIEPLRVPMERVVGVEVGAAVQRFHEGDGINFLLGRSVAAFEECAGAPAAVRLDDDRLLEADVVVEAVGCQPNVEWLDGNGLDLSDGVLCATDLAALGSEAVVAVGDVARFPNPRFDGVPRRVEHWQIAADTAKIAARTLLQTLSGTRDYGDAAGTGGPLPTFWSDQGGLRFQSYGVPALGQKRVVSHGSLSDLGAGVAVDYLRGDELVAIVSINAPAALQRDFRNRVDDATSRARLADSAGALA